jgi:group I intron endonuclease
MAYVYRHIRLDKNEPFYIGIGTDNNFKRSRTRKGRNNIWKKIANKTEFEVEILFYDIDIEEAKKKEIEFISFYGRIANNDGILANLSGGGDSSFNPSFLTRQKISIATKGDKNPFYGKKHTQETRRLLSEMQKGKKRGPLSDATKSKISEAQKGRTTWTKGKKQPIAAQKRTGVNHSTYKGPICCYDLNMNLLGTFDCARDIMKNYNIKYINEIRRVLIGERNQCYGMKFKYLNDVNNGES